MTLTVLMVTGIFPPDIGGPATHAVQLAHGLIDRGHRVTLVALGDAGEQQESSSYPFRVHRISRRFPAGWRQIRTVIEIIWVGRSADVIVALGLPLEATIANLLLRRGMVQRIVADFAWERATTRGWTHSQFSDFELASGLRTRALRRTRSWWTSRADKIIVPSRYMKSWLMGLGFSGTCISVVPNGVEARQTSTVSIPLKTEVNAVVAGRLISLKRIDVVLRAMTAVPSLGLVIVGEGPEFLHLRELARTLELEHRVYFAGLKSRQEALELMASCDLFVLASTHEGFPHVLLEAMSVGLPVIAAAVGGTPEIVNHHSNGILVKSSDEEALVNALRQLADSASARRLVARGARETAARYTLSRMVLETEAVLYKALQ